MILFLFVDVLIQNNNMEVFECIFTFTVTFYYCFDPVKSIPVLTINDITNSTSNLISRLDKTSRLL